MKISRDGLVFIQWKAKRAVHFLANHSDPTISQTISRKEKDGSSKEIDCPLVFNYNQHMGYVDKLDMLKSTYEIDRKSKKWWHRIVWYFIDMAVVNAYTIFKARSDGQVLPLKLFRIAVVNGLIGAKEHGSKMGRLRIPTYKLTVPPEIRFDSCSHMPVHGTSRRCAMCTERSESHRTRWMCNRCVYLSKTVSFHLNDLFFHVSDET